MASTTLKAMIHLFAILAVMCRGLEAQSCTTTQCTSACLLFDTSWRTCTYDSTGKGFDSLTSCACRWNGLQTTVQALAQCTACQQDGLGSNPLALYEVWTVICNTYLTEGESNALSAGGLQSSQVLNVYTASYLPTIESAYCGKDIVSPSTTSNTFTSTVDTSSGSSTPASTTTGRSSSSTSLSTPAPTPNNTNDAKAKLTHVVGATLLIIALLGFSML